MKNFAFGCAASIALALPASSSTLDTVFNGTTTGNYTATVNISATPAGSTGAVIAAPFDMTDTSGTFGDFVAFCLDLANFLQKSTTYKTTDTPFSNTFMLGNSVERVQALFNANYAALDLTNVAQGAAFQVSLWEVIYDGNDFDLTNGNFMAAGTGATAAATDTLAASYLLAASNFTGPNAYNLSFLESTGNVQSQNLVTATAVPVPAAGLLMIGALGGLLGMRRRRRQA